MQVNQEERAALSGPTYARGDQMIETLPERVNGDEALVRRGRYLTTTFLLEVGQTPWLIQIFEGRIVSVTRGPFVMPSSSFALRAPEEEWQKFWSVRPPPGCHDEEYQLTSAQYTAMILEISAALELDRPILIGCSIGGRIALHLALEHPESFRAIIGLQAGAHVDPYYDLNFLHRADVHGGEVCGAIVSRLVGPDAPDSERWETLWHYMQSGPGVFKGDLYFYQLDGDIRDRVAQIDTRRCPLFLLSGEYDYSCTPEETLAVANSIPSSEVTIMNGLGHFPISEDPQAFLTHLLPVLEKIRGR